MPGSLRIPEQRKAISGSDLESPRHVRVCRREERKPAKIKALIIYMLGEVRLSNPFLPDDVGGALGKQVVEENDLKYTS